MEARTTDVWAEHYSPRNVAILLAAGATEVAGYREWQAQGRQVRRGEHGIRLLAPVVVKDRETGEPKVVNMKHATVFDVSQTDPIARDADELEADEGSAPPSSTMTTSFERETRATQAMFADLEAEGLI